MNIDINKNVEIDELSELTKELDAIKKQNNLNGAFISFFYMQHYIDIWIYESGYTLQIVPDKENLPPETFESIKTAKEIEKKLDSYDFKIYNKSKNF